MSASDYHDAFAERLRAAMAMRGWTQSELARRYRFAARLSLTPSTSSVRHWLSGQSMPRVRSLRVLCDVLDVSADWLLGRSPTIESLGPRAASLDEADRLALAQHAEFLVARAERRRRYRVGA